MFPHYPNSPSPNSCSLNTGTEQFQKQISRDRDGVPIIHQCSSPKTQEPSRFDSTVSLIIKVTV